MAVYLYIAFIVYILLEVFIEQNRKFKDLEDE